MGRRSRCPQVVRVVIHRVRHRVLRVSLAMAIIVDYQIAGETHKPVREIALFWIILIQRAVDAYENILRQVLGCVYI
jgi:hypothetical protein